MPARMTTLAAVTTAPKTTELREMPIPEIPADGGLLKVLANGICGSDPGKYGNAKFGQIILGHEIVGIVEKLGSAAKDRWGVKEGDYVALEEYLPCGHCDYCRSGEYRSCLQADFRSGGIRYGSTGIDVPPSLYGGHSQYLYLHPRTVFHKVSEGIPPHIAAKGPPLGNGFQWGYFNGPAGPNKTVGRNRSGAPGFRVNCCGTSAGPKMS